MASGWQPPSALRELGRVLQYAPETKEHFAELMESYFLVNDHYPFLRCELRDQDATGYELIAGLWEGNPAR